MSDTDRWAADRRTVLKSAGAVGMAGLAGCTGGSDDSNTISWVMNPAEESVDIETQYQPLFEYLESEADVEIDGIQTSDYSSTVLEMQRGSGDFADTSPGAVAQVPDDIDVVGMRLAFGAEQYFSLITTTPDSDIDELADLEGEEIATAASTSVSGTLVPMLMLEQAGLDTGGAPDGTPVDFDLGTHDHDGAREQLINNPDVVAAGTGAFSTGPHVPQEQFDEMSEDYVDISVEYDDAGSREPELQLLAVSDPIPRAPIVARADWDDPIREELEELMLEADEEVFRHDEDELADQLGIDPEILDKDEDELTEEEEDDLQQFEDHELWFDGIEPATEDDYEPIVDLLDELGLSPEDVE
ncbi:PhnD/SsuA/transferrin family substrate-binding protein [Natronorubrum sp. DTA28]|uniref:PhnD/SsuA/transferrin family substrate-binding protein n=1 Tax=Natronorubrum sp. DTA28 TaxID=3447019 RepID=UPI003F82D39D